MQKISNIQIKKKIKKRIKSRELIFKVLYSLEISKNNITDIEKFITKDINLNKIDKNYFYQILEELPSKLKILDKIIINTKENSRIINIIELSILRIALFEIIYSTNIPYITSINEAIKISKKFSSKLSYKFINKILDKLIKENKVILQYYC